MAGAYALLDQVYLRFCINYLKKLTRPSILGTYLRRHHAGLGYLIIYYLTKTPSCYLHNDANINSIDINNCNQSAFCMAIKPIIINK